ncbi:6-hydroxymethylpterin diphosphokinase MptE-like protein [Pseudoalteromonas sp. Of7M-16]|uniref:motility associated factor glycosyltransferase family protein n=1 Tax=Pseudoalteromonas sp. Of7M-16 TaxID=2917756 RepID=UPI001EF3DAB0|nr:6-hydroxymethylpterin diphosphokinase MptE-like protein [Pseudoalteromonas sp. Of7M-16]MCG7549893.1 DUF115 domain-containing protein [Pseudoalteromonas sp. Of7M-16]
MSQKSLEEQIQIIDEQLANSIEHQAREAKFATEANERFARNVTGFEEYYPDIANAIKEFNVREDFCLHVTSTGHGNFVPANLSAPIYSDDPIGQVTQQVEHSIQHPMFSATDYTAYQSDPNDTRIHVRYMGAMTKALRKIKAKDRAHFAQLPENFPSAMIFGIGLGYHVELLLEKTTFDYCFLIEPDFEVFFASLFCTNWYDIIKKVDEQGGSLFFQLGANKDNFIKDLEVLADNIGAFSVVRSFCYQHTPLPEIIELIQQWSQQYFKFQFGHGFFNDAITGLSHTVHLLEKNIPMLVQPKDKRLDLSTPVFILGNGPSLDEAEAFIKENCDRAILMAAGTSIASLYKKGIPVDFHVLVERPYSNYKIFGDIFPAEEYKKTNLIGLNTLYPDNTDRYKWSGIAGKGNEAGTFLLEILSQTQRNVGIPLMPYCNPVVANAALSFAMFTGFKNIYLFGIDNGNLLTGEHHSKDSIYRINQDDESEEGIACLRMDGKYLPANFGGQVESNDLFMMAHSQLEKLIAHYPTGRNVYNIGNGAKLVGAHEVRAEELLPLPTARDKLEQIEFLKQDYFTQFDVEQYDDKLLGVDVFEDICEHMLSLANEPVTTRKQASNILLRQARYIYSFRNTPLHHLHHMIKGALLYYHCPMLSLLYTYEDDQFTLESYSELNELWKGYITEMKDFYRDNYRAKCDLGKE